VKHGTLAVNGVRLHYVEYGAGAPILFLHGFPEYWGAWRAIMKELGGQFRSVAIDTRGINLSERPKSVSGYTMDELVEDVRQTIGALGYDKLTLVGHDWGGFIAWETAIPRSEAFCVSPKSEIFGSFLFAHHSKRAVRIDDLTPEPREIVSGDQFFAAGGAECQHILTCRGLRSSVAEAQLLPSEQERATQRR
jgi:pimeloyl-ACP methyl ester carboxylesterase